MADLHLGTTLQAADAHQWWQHANKVGPLFDSVVYKVPATVRPTPATLQPWGQHHTHQQDRALLTLLLSPILVSSSSRSVMPRLDSIKIMALQQQQTQQATALCPHSNAVV